MAVLEHDLQNLSRVYNVALDSYKGKDYVVVYNFNLLPGYNLSSIPVLLSLPDHYPEAAPGVGGSRVYVPSTLRYHGKEPTDFHLDCGPTPDFAWWCYEAISWDPCNDDLIIFFELLRAHMTNPPTKGF